MKNLVLAVLFFLLTSTAFSQNVFAQTGTFRCKIGVNSFGFKDCIPDPAASRCAPGHVPDDPVCERADNWFQIETNCPAAGGACVPETGTFSCDYHLSRSSSGTRAGCFANYLSNKCEPGFSPSLSYCTQFDADKNACDNQKSIPCVPEGSIQADPNIGPAADPTCESSDNRIGIDTAIGCIPVEDPNAFLGFILRWAIGIGGGIAFLLVVYASFMIMTSSGNPERLQAGKELLTSAIMGVILLVFSVFILKVIGVDILNIPGFGQ